MAKEFKKWQLAFIAGLILIIPVVLVYQYTKADIVLRDIDIEPTFRCFPQENSFCVFEIGTGQSTTFEENVSNWTVFGEEVVCFRAMNDVEEPIGVVAPQQMVTCNDVGIFDKELWNLAISHADLIDGGSLDTLIFTRIGV